MNGNRGAKGSIKDRLISMLYRMRYKKKELKEEEYTKAKKEKQIDYLNTLNNFREKEDISALEKEDIDKLDNVKFKVNFKIEKKNVNKNQFNSQRKNVNTNQFKVSKKGIAEVEDIDVALYSIEAKTSELDEKVEVKKEIKKTKSEVTIIKEVDSFIVKSLENIKNIQEELEKIKEESKDKNKDQTELEERYKILKEKVKKLKEQYDAIKDKYDLSEFKIVESIKLIDAVDDYKSVARLNEMDMMLKVCKKEISKIDTITIINTETQKVGTDIEETKDNQDKIKIKFNASKEKTKKIKNVKEDLEEELKYQKKIIDDMYNKASYLKKETHIEEYYVGKRKVIGSLLKMAGGILTLPLTGRELFGVALGQTMINKGLKELNRPLEKKYREVVNYDYEDISKKIENVNDKLEYTSLVIGDSLNEIDKLKNNFQNEYKEYDKILSEYDDTLTKINKLENDLKLEQEKINNMNKTLEVEKELNKEKMKKIR